MKIDTIELGSNPFVVMLFSIFLFGNVYSQQTWVQVPSPDTSNSRNLLSGISGTSSSDVWTVGHYQAFSGGQFNLILHWDGNGWQHFSGTDLGFNYNILWDVTAVTADDVWIAGTYNAPGNSRSQLIHWNGSALTHTLLPDITGGSALFSIDAISDNDIWAVGGRAASPADLAYSIHYDGSSWTEILADSPGAYSNRFYSVDGISSNDAWAVGRQGDSYGDFHAMAQHWDGSSWSSIALPSDVSSPIGDLESVTMISSDDVWALGSTITGELLMIHWDGTSWSEVPPEGGQGGAIASRAPDLFGFGGRISQWDGIAWSVIDSLNHLSDPTLVSSVTFSNGDVWAAGHTYDSYFHTLVYRTEPAILPVMIDYYSIHKIGETASMRWRTTSEINTKEFVMERSSDMKEFMPVNHTGAHGSEYNYELVDSSPLPGLNYYRLRAIDLDGRVKTMPVQSLNFQITELIPFSVYPNPVVGRDVKLLLNFEGDGVLYLHDQHGKEVMTRNVTGDMPSTRLNLPLRITSGIYILTLIKDQTAWSEKIFVQ